MRLHISSILLFALIVLASGCGSKYFLQSGINDYNNLYYSDAIDNFDKSLAKNPDNYDANVMAAKTYMKLHDYKRSAEYFEHAVEYPQSTAEDKFNYAKSLMSINEHDKAEEIFTAYLSLKSDDEIARSLRQSCQYISLLIDDTAKYHIEAIPMFDNISMFSPVRYKDGIAFTAEKSANNNQDPWTGNSFYDINYLEKDGDGWAQPKMLSGEINGKFHDGPISFDKDETFAVFTRSYSVNDKRQGKSADNFNNLFLHSADYVDTSWVNVQQLPFNDVNYTCMHPTLSNNGDILYFASDMPGGFGGTDLYKSNMVNGIWSVPVNLGRAINTKGNETFPNLASDTLLYFSSDGHPSLGGLDIFSTSSARGVWEIPKNLNYPINTVLDDFGYVYSKADTVGYFSSKRNGFDQIFKVKEIYEGVVSINGLIVDELSGETMDGVLIKVIDKNTGEVLEEFTTNSDGTFNLDLLAGKNYKIEASKEGYLLQSYERSTMNQFLDETEDVLLSMKKAVIIDPDTPYDNTSQGVFEIPNIFYDLNDYNIRPDAAFELEKVYKVLQDNPNISIELNSHTDSRAVDAYNMALSIKRAKAAKSFLVKKGIVEARISFKGFGETKLTNDCGNDVNCSEEKHQENRRTEFIITKLD
ncbi:MAG: peptidoglycan-associated lipoprotein [Patiriisocius sp.]|jgi:peptidoglycan-associated lipoprotein